MTDTSKREELIERPWTQDHYVTRNSISEDDTYRVWMTCRCGWNSGDLPDGNLPTTHQAELEHYVAVFEQAHTPTEHECTWACWVDRYGQDHHAPTDDEREAARDEAKVQFPSSVDSRAAFMAGWMKRARRPVQAEPTGATEEYFETLRKIDPSEGMARIIEQAKRDLAKRAALKEGEKR